MGTINVFVYGTLKPGGIYHQQFCAPYLKTSQPTQVRGLLYDLPKQGYPVLTMGDGWVKGYLFTLDQRAMVGLDVLEGYTPDGQGSLVSNINLEENDDENYTRWRVSVFALDGGPLGEAWVYGMDKAPDGAVWLPQGEWTGA